MAKSKSTKLKDEEWLCSVEPSKTRYFPQLGDQVVYLKQAHQEYLEEVKKRRLCKADQFDEPWISISFNELEVYEYVKVVEIRYVIQQLRFCGLKLQSSDNRSFTVKYRSLDGVADFLILRQIFDATRQRKWRSGQRLLRSIGKDWFYGQVVSVQDYNRLRYPGSLYKRLRVEWDDKRLEEVSPWEVEPFNQKANCTKCGLGFSECDKKLCCEAPRKIGKLMYRPKFNEWPDDGRNSACRRFLHGLRQLMRRAIAKPFLELNSDPSYFSMVKYPVDLQMIHDRLENLFYRRVEAIRFDVQMLAKNIQELQVRPMMKNSFLAEKYTLVQCKKVTENLLKIIEDPSESEANESKTSSSSRGVVGRKSNKRVADDNESDESFSSEDETFVENVINRRKVYADKTETRVNSSSSIANPGKRQVVTKKHRTPWDNDSDDTYHQPSAQGKQSRNNRAKTIKTASKRPSKPLAKRVIRSNEPGPFRRTNSHSRRPAKAKLAESTSSESDNTDCSLRSWISLGTESRSSDIEVNSNNKDCSSRSSLTLGNESRSSILMCVGNEESGKEECDFPIETVAATGYFDPVIEECDFPIETVTAPGYFEPAIEDW